MNVQFFLPTSIACCDQLVINSTGAAVNHRSTALGTYRNDGISNGRVSYKNDKDNDNHLHFAPNNNWMVSIEYYCIIMTYFMEMKKVLVLVLYIWNINTVSREMKLNGVNTYITL